MISQKLFCRGSRGYGIPASAGSFAWPAIACEGDATIVLEGESFVRGFQKNPGIYVPDGYTLTICGTGSLTASSNGSGAGIGGAADINSMNGVSCGNITIAGGSITATGGSYSADIGSGYKGSCSMVMVRDCINSVKATAGQTDAMVGADPIGAGYNGRCGSVSVDDVLGDETRGTTRTIVKWHTSNLSGATEGVVYGDGSVITGTFDGDYAITIADGATVTLLDASIHPGGPLDGYGSFDGLTCEGDATIILEGSNTVNSVNAGYPAIYAHYGKTLTIKERYGFACRERGLLWGGYRFWRKPYALRQHRHRKRQDNRDERQ